MPDIWEKARVGTETPDSWTNNEDWKRELARAVRDPAVLLDRLDLPRELLPPAQAASRDFPLLVPESFLRRMRPGDPHDPLLRQVLPVGDELTSPPGFGHDAVGDGGARVARGLIHKYHGRALLIATGTCAVHCRYCFRRHYPYGDEPRKLEDWEPALRAIAADPSLKEIILSGGDPLILSDARLETLVEQLAAIPHLTRLRIHSRLPIVLPSRVTESLVASLRSTRLQPWMVVHANHPAEVRGDCAAALRALSQSGVPTLNQTVLLQGVNDDAAVLAELSEALIDLGVMPYYLHQLDHVAGAAHFEVPESRGLQVVQELRDRLPGYAVPRYVREVPGDPSKQVVSIEA